MAGLCEGGNEPSGSLKAISLQELQRMEKIPDEERVAAVYTDSNITISLLKRNTKHNTLIAHIHNTLSALQQRNWTIHFGWVKAHAGLYGNELADRLAKAASTEGEVIYKKIPKSKSNQKYHD
ncbi:hypothetical protein ANN_14057 [Periplaneta americana]|uniref:RNase H type-1 domain-containing protein n=1 Tax=Periplaneta americana TaxID=6978 RepID=A0ABQ8SV88_PERAM|nr:hypothetical protein ANN_14057 [Periplaneta americana]